jgi:hypothetical protein
MTLSALEWQVSRVGAHDHFDERLLDGYQGQAASDHRCERFASR